MKKKWLIIVGMAVMLSLSGCVGAKDTEKEAEIHTEQKDEKEAKEEIEETEEAKSPKEKKDKEKESLTGWVEENDVWYYYTEDGERLAEDWLEDKDVWYYFDSEGKMIQNSWKEVDGKLYYFGEDGGMYVNTTTPDGSKVDESGAKVIVMTVAQKKVIERFLEEEMRRYYGVQDHIYASELTKEDVRSFGHTLLFYDPVLDASILSLQGTEFIYDRESYYNLNDTIEFLKNMFGVDPEIKNGECYDDYGKTNIDDPNNDYDSLLYVKNDRVFSEFREGNNGDTWGVLENVRYKAQGDRIRIEGLFTEESNGGLIYMDVPFVAEFKINPKNHFPYQLVSVEWDYEAGIDPYADSDQVQDAGWTEANHRVVPEAEILWHFLDNPSDFQEEAGDYTGIVMPEDAMFAMADVTGDYVDDLVVKTVLYGMAYDDLVWDQYLVFDGTMADTVADQTYLGDVQFFEGGYVTEWMPEYCDKHYLLYLIDNVNVGLYYAGNPVDSFLAGDWDNIEEVRADMEARAEVYNVDLTGWDPAEGVEMSLEEAQLRVKQFVSGKQKLSLNWTPLNVRAVEDYFDVVY